MTHGYRATADIEPVIRNFQPILAVQNLHRERFIQIPQADIPDRDIEALHQLRHGKNRTTSHFVSRCASDCQARVASTWPTATLSGKTCLYYDASRRPIRHIGGFSAGKTERDGVSEGV